METMTSAKLCVCFAYAVAFAQPSGRGVISGTVLDASSGDAVRKAVVTATWHGTPRAWATTQTDGSGKFTIEGLPAGKYELRAVKSPLGTAIYGANSVRELGDLVTLADGEAHGGITLLFLRSSSISGHVVDPDGDPIPNASVNLLRSGRNLGERVLTNFRGANTDDRGEYKITGVDPGEYYLRCSPNEMQRRGLPHEMVVSQYYGGSRESKDAAPLNLRGGEVLAGVDFHLIAERPATISGHVTNVPALDPPNEEPNQVNGVRFNRMNRGGGRVSVNFSPAGDDSRGWSMGVGTQLPDYHFDIPENVPGRYRVEASTRVKDKTYYASQMVDAHEGANEIVLALSPGVEVKGHLKIEGPAEHPVQSFTVALAPPGQEPMRQRHTAHVGKDGSFTIEDVPAGEWVMNITPNPGGIFEKSVRLGDKDVLYKRIEIPPGSDAPLNIVLSSNMATVEGEVDAGGAGGDTKRAGILMVPAGKWHTLARLYHVETTDDAGKFKIHGVAPGKYKIFALEKISASFYRNPESADLIDAFGEEFDVAEGAKVQSNPKLIPEEKAKELLKQ